MCTQAEVDATLMDQRLTAHEKNMFDWAGPVIMWLSGKLDTIEDAKILSFFKSMAPLFLKK